MQFKINPRSIEWWYWVFTLVGFGFGLSGVIEGFYAVIAISVVQTLYFAIGKGPIAFPTQVRFVYTLFTVIALFDPTRIFYWLLLVGTLMVTFFDRCIIARMLVMMPWNRGVKLS